MSIVAPASFSKIRAEFGTGSTSLKAYVRGGTIVADTPGTAGIPTAVAGMSVSDFNNACSLTLSQPKPSIFGSASSKMTRATVTGSVNVTLTGGVSGAYTLTATCSNASISISVSGTAPTFTITASALVNDAAPLSGVLTTTAKRGTACTQVATGNVTLEFYSTSTV